MDWLSQHTEIISLLINGAMLFVWIFYAHLLLNNYHRQRRPKLLINQGLGGTLDARCLVCNMSEEAIYIALVIAEVQTAEDSWKCAVADLTPSRGDPKDINATLKDMSQGPLKAGEFRDMHSFRTLLDRALASRGYGDFEEASAQGLEICRMSVHLIAVYGSEDAPVGATRHFDLIKEEGGGDIRLRPTQVDTQRLSTPKQRRQVRRWLEEYL